MKWVFRFKHIYYFSVLILTFFAIESNAIFIVGHRGARGLMPESTLLGYHKAIQLGVHYIDMDVVMTKDHELVAYHDLALNPDITRDKNNRWVKKPILIKDLTLKELKTYNVGAIKTNTSYAKFFPKQISLNKASIPSLREVIINALALNRNIKFQIEIKTDPTKPNDSYSPELIAKTLVQLLKEFHINDRVRIQAFDWRCLYAIQALDKDLKTAYLTNKDQEILMANENSKIAGIWTGGKLLKHYHGSLPRMIKSLGGSAWDPESSSLTEKSRLEAAQLNLQVVVWSDTKDNIDELAELKRVLHLKVDGIITDRPDLALRVLNVSDPFPTFFNQPRF